MTTVLLPITTRKNTLSDIVKIIKNSIHKDIKLHIACEKNNKIISEFEKIKTNDKLKISLDIFSVGTSEESMINSVLRSIPDTNFLLVRNNTENFTTKNIDNVLTDSLLGYDIVMLQKDKKSGKFNQFLINTAKKLCKTFFNFTYYDGDIGIQFFNAQAHAILKTTNTTLLTKLNRWLALNIHYVLSDIKTTQITSSPPKKSIFWSVFYSAFFVLTIIGAIILPLWATITLIIAMIIISAFVVEVALGLYYFIDIYNYKKVGILSCEKIDAIERRETWQVLKNWQKY